MGWLFSTCSSCLTRLMPAYVALPQPRQYWRPGARLLLRYREPGTIFWYLSALVFLLPGSDTERLEQLCQLSIFVPLALEHFLPAVLVLWRSRVVYRRCPASQRSTILFPTPLGYGSLLQQRTAYSPLHGRIDAPLLEKTDLGLCRVNVDIEQCRVKLDVNHGNGVASTEQQRVVCLLHGIGEHAAEHPAAVNEE